MRAFAFALSLCAPELIEHAGLRYSHDGGGTAAVVTIRGKEAKVDFLKAPASK